MVSGNDWAPGPYPPRVVGVPPPTNGFAITALVSSLVVAPLGIIFGHLALRQIRRTGEGGRGLAIGGLVIGYVATTLAIAAIVVTVVALNSIPNTFMETNEAEGIERAEVEDWLGAWMGTVEQPGYGYYSVQMTLSHNGQTVVGTVSYPELRCSGELGEARLVGDVLYVVETISVNGGCVSSVTLELTLGTDYILYHYDSGGGGDGTLRRV